ncbi:S-layer homology domain-containing protein [Brevibacillus daliensis]|uniref:S-layer homology domain-containing protein n=1 Tax=Brevibacillus daliensis TaxID=2892995 RepID=UPI0035A1A5D9
MSREESAVLLARALNLQGDSKALTFKDKNTIKNVSLVGAAVKANIIKGFPENSFKPKASLTRAHAAQLIHPLLP